MSLFNSSNNSLDELVFENRNKMYGAYAIRKAYPTHMNRSVLFAMMPFILAVAAMLISQFLHPVDPMPAPPSFAGFKNIDVIVPIKKIEFILSGGATATEIENPVYKVVPDHKADPIVQKKLDVQKPLSPVQAGTEGTTNSGTVVGEGSTTGQPTQGTVIVPVPEPTPEIGTIAEIMPEFPGGMDALYKFIAGKLVYPRPALENGISGRVMLSFVVTADGSVDQIKVERGPGFGLDEEALRVVQSMPRWTPASQNGKKVPVRLMLPIRFQPN